MQSEWEQAAMPTIEEPDEFYNAIDRSHLVKDLTPDRAYIYVTMEVYDKMNGIKGGGGLGILAADTRRVAQDLEIPFVTLTPFYPLEVHQRTVDLAQEEYREAVSPEEFGFERVGDVTVRTSEHPDTKLDIYQKILGSTRFLTMTEPNFGELYQGDGSGDHRLYQEMSLGFGGYKALHLVGIKPAVIQLNETATIFAAIARLDELCNSGMNIYEAIVYVRKHTLYTNHTLLQAAEGSFSYDQFERIIMPNIESSSLRQWLKRQFEGVERLQLSALAIELAEAKTGVSKLHARVADFHDRNGDKVKFSSVTNGIHMHTWVHPEIMQFFGDHGILDRFGLPTDDFVAKLDTITAADIKRLKSVGRVEMNQHLAVRKDQYGVALSIPDDAFVYHFKRRFVDYKRPYLPFERPDELKSILTEYNAHYILAGKVHTGDAKMYDHLKQVLQLIDADPVFKQRVHYIQDYDEQVGRALAIGGNSAINVPIVGLEACGTSWEKDIANLGLLISTNDGGVADVQPLPCLEVSGSTYEAEVDSLYAQMRLAGELSRDDEAMREAVIKQLAGYLPVISGARMLKDYLRYLFNK
ncbi:MAG: glycogen/starch/alpha-glucan phosphorylase [Candidatus Saccharimonadaceae bacterium]